MSTKKAMLKYRVEKGLRQTELAEKLNITQAHLSQLETGSRLPSKQVSIRLVELGVISDGILYDNSKIVDLFVNKINKVVDEFRGLDLSVAEAIGAFDLIKYDIIEENKESEK